MDTVQVLNIILALVVLLILVLAGVAVIIIFKYKNKKEQARSGEQEQAKKQPTVQITRDGKGIDSIYKFMEFDKIIDSMIVRKNYKQYIMVLECKGVNYDLLSEEDKNAVELGFIELLNTLRFPIQLYIQTRTLNLAEILLEYKKRTDDMQDQINRIKYQITQARSKGDQEMYTRLQLERQRRQNILEYGQSVEEYTRKMSEGRNILQQKTYIIISYYTSEYGDVSKYSREELNDIVFSELYTRCQTVIRALVSAEVTGRILSSEELAELLYVAYNRDESEKLRLKNALDAEYDRLYSTAKDVMEEKKRRLEAMIDSDASKVATKSILRADQITREERQRRVKERAKQMVNEYKDELSRPLYEETNRQIDNANVDALLNEQENQRRVIRRDQN